MKLIYLSAAASCLLIATSCEKSDGTGESGANVSSDSTTAVRTIRPERSDITRTLALPANIRAHQKTTIYAKVAGYLHAIHADIGDAVTRGELLAEIEAPEMLAERAKAMTEVKVAESEFQRISGARAKASDLVMPQAVDESKGRFEVRKAELKRLDTLLNYARLTAPFDGVVTARYADPGAFIPAATSSSAVENAALLQIADFRKVRVEVDVPEVDVTRVRVGLIAEVHRESSPDANLVGKVSRFAYALNPMTKTMKVEIDIDNPDLILRPGMMATVSIDIESREGVLTVPASSLVLEKGNTFLFVVRDNKAARVPVEIGFDDGKAVEIISGLSEQDAVIHAGKQKISHGQSIEIVQVETNTNTQ
jgi:membrane fusion protein (multidrug efflux system)